MRDLPTGWNSATLGQIAEISGGLTKNDAKRRNSNDIVPLVSVAAVRLRSIDKQEIGSISLLAEDGNRGELEPGDLLLVEGNGSLSHIGRVAIWDRCVSRARHQNHIIRIRPTRSSSRFLLEWLASPAGRTAIIAEATSGAGLYTLSLSKVARLPVPLPPIAEQRRIVAKLDELLSRRRRSKEALDAVPTLIEKFRQSVLAAAFRGDLTAAWRAKNPNVEPASKLLERIRAERRRRWEEAELEKMRAKGKLPKDEAWKQKYAVPAKADDFGSPLTDGWAQVPAELCALEITVGHVGPMKNEYLLDGVPFLRSQNVRANRFDPAGLQFVSPDFHARLAKSALHPGDVAIVRSGAPGTACVIPQSILEANCSDLVVVRLVRSINPELFAYFVNSDAARVQVLDMQVGMAQQHFNIGSMRKLRVPLIPPKEQTELLRIIGSAFAAAARIEATVRAQLEQLERLDMSTLAAAFRGELVPQDPNDEPADVMLERIRSKAESLPSGRSRVSKRVGRESWADGR